MIKIKKVLATILSVLAILGTYIGFNQLTNRNGDTYTPPKRKPPTRTQGGSSRKEISTPPDNNKVQ